VDPYFVQKKKMYNTCAVVLIGSGQRGPDNDDVSSLPSSSHDYCLYYKIKHIICVICLEEIE